MSSSAFSHARQILLILTKALLIMLSLPNQVALRLTLLLLGNSTSCLLSLPCLAMVVMDEADRSKYPPSLNLQDLCVWVVELVFIDVYLYVGERK